MSEAIGPLDPVDAAAIADGVIAGEDARTVDEVDTEPGLDSERIVLLEDLEGRITNPEAESERDLDLLEAADPSDQ